MSELKLACSPLIETETLTDDTVRQLLVSLILDCKNTGIAVNKNQYFSYTSKIIDERIKLFGHQDDYTRKIVFLSEEVWEAYSKVNTKNAVIDIDLIKQDKLRDEDTLLFTSFNNIDNPFQALPLQTRRTDNFEDIIDLTSLDKDLQYRLKMFYSTFKLPLNISIIEGYDYVKLRIIFTDYEGSKLNTINKFMTLMKEVFSELELDILSINEDIKSP